MPRKDDLIAFDPETGRCETTPRQLFLELTPRCNLSCVHCSKDYGLEWPDDRDMQEGTLRALEPWLLQAHAVNLNLVGEPLIATHFGTAIAICARGRAAVSFNTNGLGLDDRTCDELVAARVAAVVVSVDGLESNAPIRGVPYSTLRKRILALAAARKRAHSELPHLGIAYTLMRRNLHELPRLLDDLLRDVKLEYVHVQPLIEFYETLRGQNVYHQAEADEVVARSREIAARHGAELTLFRSTLSNDEGENVDGEELQLGQRSRRFGCSDPFYEVKILADGSVQSCSFGLAGGFNVNTTPLDAIWNSNWYRQLRLRLVRRAFLDRCRICPYVFGSAANQQSLIRTGVEHSRAARFRSGALGNVPKALPPPVARPFLDGRPGRPPDALA